MTQAVVARCLGAVVSLLLVAGCSEEKARSGAGANDSGGSCPRAEDAAGPVVSFEGDLMPLFSMSCAFGACHDIASHQAGLDLGPNFNDGPADAGTRTQVLASLLAASTTTPDLPRVTPFEPARSFLMLKLEGCQNEMGLRCTSALPGQPCGARMPAVSNELPADKRALVWRWIAQGAKGQ